MATLSLYRGKDGLRLGLRSQMEEWTYEYLAQLKTENGIREVKTVPVYVEPGERPGYCLVSHPSINANFGFLWSLTSYLMGRRNEFEAARK